jgi:hypothetical protein
MRSITTTLLTLLLSLSINAQTWRANLYAGYVMGETVFSATDPKTGATNQIKGGLHFAAGLEYRKQEKKGYEILLLNQSTSISDWYYTDRGEQRTTSLDARFNHLMFSAMNYGKAAKVQPFGGLMAGVGFINLKNPDKGKALRLKLKQVHAIAENKFNKHIGTAFMAGVASAPPSGSSLYGNTTLGC